MITLKFTLFLLKHFTNTLEPITLNTARIARISKSYFLSDILYEIILQRRSFSAAMSFYASAVYYDITPKAWYHCY